MVKYEMYLNITKAIYDEPMVNIFSVMETQTIWRQGSILATSSQYRTGSPSHSEDNKNKNKYKEPMNPNVQSSTIYISQVLEATQVPISKWMDQKTVVHLYNGILHSRKKEGTPTLCDSMSGSGKHYAKWNKPGNERQIPYDLTMNRNLIDKMNEQAKYSQRHWSWEQADSDQKGEGRE